MNAVLEIQGVTKEDRMGETNVHALRGVDLTIYEVEFVVILGPSGSGKITILNIVGSIDSPTAGKILYRGEDISGYSQKQLTAYRRSAVGFVFQFYNLMQNLTALENLTLAAELSASPISPWELLEQMDLGYRSDHLPAQMSRGQQQRVAIACAIAKNPNILLYDEPTGALNVSIGIAVLRLLRRFNQSYGKTVVIFTHNAAIGQMADRVLAIRDGVVYAQAVNAHPVSPEEASW